MYQYSAYITRIIDADTVEAILDIGFSLSIKHHFRVDGFDAPESHRPKNEAEAEHAERANKRAVDLLFEKTLTFHTSRLGIYGRYGAAIFLEDGRNYAEVMKEEGFSKKDSYE
jgi:endonuclease YncB( thermonuclease family)